MWTDSAPAFVAGPVADASGALYSRERKGLRHFGGDWWGWRRTFPDCSFGLRKRVTGVTPLSRRLAGQSPHCGGAHTLEFASRVRPSRGAPSYVCTVQGVVGATGRLSRSLAQPPLLLLCSALSDAAVRQTREPTPGPRAAHLQRTDECIRTLPAAPPRTPREERGKSVPPLGMEAYELISRQGVGSYAVVWKARERGTGRLVAIKELKQTCATWEEVVAMKEVAVMRAVGAHPNVLRMHAVTRLAGRAYLVLDQCDCNVYQLMSSARSLSSGRGSFTEPEVRWLMRQVLAGLAHMHGQGWMHRDIKPENVLLCASDSTAKVCDFGQARQTSPSGGSSKLTDYVSTRWYRAPELLLHAAEYGSPVDVWAVGCMMAECFTFRAVFPGDSEVDTLFKVASVVGSPGAGWKDASVLAASLGIRLPDTLGVGLASLLPKASPAALSAVAGMLTWNPASRPTAQAMLRHPFFAEGPCTPIKTLGAASMRQGEEALAKADALAAQADIDRALAGKPDSTRSDGKEGEDADSDAGEGGKAASDRDEGGKGDAECKDRDGDSSSDEEGAVAYKPQHRAGQGAAPRAAVSRNPFAACEGSPGAASSLPARKDGEVTAVHAPLVPADVARRAALMETHPRATAATRAFVPFPPGESEVGHPCSDEDDGDSPAYVPSAAAGSQPRGR